MRGQEFFFLCRELSRHPAGDATAPYGAATYYQHGRGYFSLHPAFLVWKSLLYTVLPYYRKRHSFVCSFLPSDRAHANPLRQRAQATTGTSTGNGKFSCRWCASAAGRVRRKRPFAWLRSAPPQARHPTVQGFRPVRSGAMHFACLTRTF